MRDTSAVGVNTGRPDAGGDPAVVVAVAVYVEAITEDDRGLRGAARPARDAPRHPPRRPKLSAHHV